MAARKPVGWRHVAAAPLAANIKDETTADSALRVVPRFSSQALKRRRPMCGRTATPCSMLMSPFMPRARIRKPTISPRAAARWRAGCGSRWVASSRRRVISPLPGHGGIPVIVLGLMLCAQLVWARSSSSRSRSAHNGVPDRACWPQPESSRSPGNRAAGRADRAAVALPARRPLAQEPQAQACHAQLSSPKWIGAIYAAAAQGMAVGPEGGRHTDAQEADCAQGRGKGPTPSSRSRPPDAIWDKRRQGALIC